MVPYMGKQGQFHLHNLHKFWILPNLSNTTLSWYKIIHPIHFWPSNFQDLCFHPTPGPFLHQTQNALRKPRGGKATCLIQQTTRNNKLQRPIWQKQLRSSQHPVSWAKKNNTFSKKKHQQHSARLGLRNRRCWGMNSKVSHATPSSSKWPSITFGKQRV